MKRLSVFISVAALLVLIPVSVEARQSRVYIRFSIGSAVIMGGGFLAWNLTYVYQVSRKDGEQTDRSVLAKSIDTGHRQKPTILQNQLLHTTPISYQLLTFELPLIVFRW